MIQNNQKVWKTYIYELLINYKTRTYTIYFILNKAYFFELIKILDKIIYELIQYRKYEKIVKS
jgi:ABC-type amino acid transport substrate-binding protein